MPAEVSRRLRNQTPDAGHRFVPRAARPQLPNRRPAAATSATTGHLASLIEAPAHAGLSLALLVGVVLLPLTLLARALLPAFSLLLAGHLLIVGHLLVRVGLHAAHAALALVELLEVLAALAHLALATLPLSSCIWSCPIWSWP